MDLSIVIVNWNTRDLLANCLRSIFRTAAGLDIQVVVVDNASTDSSASMVHTDFSEVQLIANPKNVGFAPANNQAIRDSVGRYVILLNSDTEVHAGALETMVRSMEENPRVGGCGPRLLNPDGTLQPSCHPMLTPEREFWRLVFLDHLWRHATYAQDRWRIHQVHQVEVIKGACLMLRRAALDDVGLLDERYFMYTEEMDLCYRLGRAGWELWWVPQATVTHYGEASSKQVAEAMYVQLYRSKVQFHRKFGGTRRANWFKGLLYTAYLPRLVFASLGTRVAPSLGPQARAYRRLLAELPKM